MATATRTRPRDRRTRIIGAGARLFGERGYHGVGIDDVAGAVDITGGAIYRHFANKREILANAIGAGLDLVEGAIEGASSLADAIPRLAALAVDDRDLGVLLQREVRHLSGEEQQIVLRRTTALRTRLVRLLVREQSGLPTADADFLVLSALAVLASPSYHRVPGGEDVVACMATAVIAHPVATSAPPRRAAGQGATTGIVARASRRETLLSAATQLFARHGYGAVRMEDVGAAAGVSGPSIYEHFTGKADLLYAALTRGGEWLQFGLTRALADPGPPAIRLTEFVKSYVDFVLRHTDLMAVLLTEVIHLPVAQRNALRRMQHDYLAEWVHLLREVRPDVTEAGARFRIQAVFTLVNDNARSHRSRRRADLESDLVDLGLAVLQT